MGNIHCSIPTSLALSLRDTFGLRAFVETGLGQGTSTLWACQHFDMVVSIETDGELVDKFRASYQDSSAMIIHGDSAIEMLEVVNRLTIPALFWLDAHTDDYCPVLAELAAINLSTLPHIIMVDDWRLFGALPKWPSRDKVIFFANRPRTYEIDDVLVCHI